MWKRTNGKRHFAPCSIRAYQCCPSDNPNSVIFKRNNCGYYKLLSPHIRSCINCVIRTVVNATFVELRLLNNQIPSDRPFILIAYSSMNASLFHYSLIVLLSYTTTVPQPEPILETDGTGRGTVYFCIFYIKSLF